MYNKIKFKAFGKVIIKRKSFPRNRALEKDSETDEQKTAKNGRAGQIWQRRKQIVGGNKKNMLPNAIRNPDTGKLEVRKKRIKEVTLKYCIDLLANNIPEEQFKDALEKKKKSSK